MSTDRFDQLLLMKGVWVRTILVDYSDGVVQTQNDLEAKVLDAIDEALRDRTAEMLVIVEDGGHGTLACSRRQRAATLAVEQTMRGHRRSLHLERAGRLPHPVVSVARSMVKTRLETPALAIRICDELSSYLTIAGASLVGASVRLFGYGVLGRALAWRCRDAYACRVQVVERDHATSELAISEGFPTVARGSWTRADEPWVVIGATGTDIWRDGLILSHLPRELYLCSASSGDIEFRSLLAYLRHASESSTRGAFGSSYLLPGGQRLVAIADGRPVNFFRPEGVSLPVLFGDLIFARMVRCMHVGLMQRGSLKARVHELSDNGLQGLTARWKEAQQLGDEFVWPPLAPHAVAEMLAARSGCSLLEDKTI
jgi:S-adenosylhomocysteine hydrolase